MGQLLRSQPEVDDYVRGADERSRQRELEARRVVLVQHREVIARADARRTQRARRAADPVVELRPGPALVAEHQRLPVRGFGDPSLNDVEDAGEFGSHRNLPPGYGHGSPAPQGCWRSGPGRSATGRSGNLSFLRTAVVRAIYASCGLPAIVLSRRPGRQS